MERICIVILIFAPFVIPVEAWAYLDPGSASLWVQGVLALVAACVAAVRAWWRVIVSMLKKGSRE